MKLNNLYQQALLNLSLMLDVHVLPGIVERLTDIPSMDSNGTILSGVVVSNYLPSTSTFIKHGVIFPFFTTMAAIS